MNHTADSRVQRGYCYLPGPGIVFPAPSSVRVSEAILRMEFNHAVLHPREEVGRCTLLTEESSLVGLAYRK